MMKNTLTNKVLTSLVVASGLSIYSFVDIASAAVVYEAPPDHLHSGKYYTANDTDDGILKITGNIPAEVDSGIVGKYFDDVKDNTKYAGNKVIIDSVDFTENFGVGQGVIAGAMLYGGIHNNIEVCDNHVIISGKSSNINISDMGRIVGAIEDSQYIKSYLHDNVVYIDSIKSCSVDKIAGAMGCHVQNNKTVVKDSEIKITWDFISGGNAAFGEEGDFANSNIVEIINSKIELENGDGIVGGYTVKGEANGNQVIISGDNTVIKSDVYGGISLNGTADDNSIILKDNANLSEAQLVGSAIQGSGNKLIIDGWSGKDVKGAYNFSDINLQNIKWQNGGTVLNITANDESDALKNTMINHDGMIISGGSNLSAGDSMTLIKGQDLGITDSNVAADGTFTAGVTVAGIGEAQVADMATVLVIQ